MDGVGPNKEMGPSICTPTQAIQHSGFSPKNSKGGLQRTCKVYLRQRWYKKKQHMGQIHPDALTEKGTTSLHSQHLHNTIQKGIAFNTNYDLSTRPAPQVDDPEGSLETQHLQQASNIWNMAQHLGVTRGDDHHLIIEKNDLTSSFTLAGSAVHVSPIMTPFRELFLRLAFIIK